MDDSPTIKTTLLCNVEEQKWRVWLATQFRKWGTNYEYICTRMQHLTWTRPNKHEDEPKTARVLEKAKRRIQTCTWRKILYGTKRLKHAMLRNSRAECEGDILQCRWDDCAVNTVHSHQGARKAVPAIASTHPRAREGGAKADLRDGEARKQTW